MKYIFIDSNIFFDNWHLTSADFSLLRKLVMNSTSTLLISEVVCLEVQNLFAREQQKVLNDLKKNYEKAQRFNTQKEEHDWSGLIRPYDFKKVLTETMEFVSFLPFNDIPHSEVIDRAVRKIMPFRDKEKGYRDTIIWLSLLQHLKTRKSDDEVFFVSNNIHDFYKSDGKEFHEDLAADLVHHEVTCSITPFISLNVYIKAWVETNEDMPFDEAINELMDEFDDQIEDFVQWELDIRTTAQFKKLLEESGSSLRHIHTLLDYQFHIEEGIEDGKALSFKRLSVDRLYIRCSFELRICSIELTIPTSEYLQHRSGIDLFYKEVDNSDEDETHILYYFRPAFEVSFVYYPEDKNITGFELLSMTLRT